MKMVIMVMAIMIASCASNPKNDQFKNGGADCAMMCKAHPEVKEYSRSQGGGFTFLFFGGEEQKCACQR